jgi:hypothetical protein
MSQLEQFGSYTKAAAAKARSEEANAAWLKMQPGTNVVRLLPPLVGMDEPWITIYQHFLKIGGKTVVFNCPRRMENKRCPACEKGDRLKATGNPADEKAAKDYWAGQRNIAFAFNRDDMDSGVQMFPFGKKIKDRLRHFREKLGKDYTDFETGFDIVVERSGTGLNTDYQTDLGEQCSIVADMSQLEKWVKDLPDLKSFAKVLPYDTIVEKFAGSTPPPATTSRPAIAGVQDGAGEVDDGSDPY